MHNTYLLFFESPLLMYALMLSSLICFQLIISTNAGANHNTIHVNPMIHLRPEMVFPQSVSPKVIPPEVKREVSNRYDLLLLILLGILGLLLCIWDPSTYLFTGFFTNR